MQKAILVFPSDENVQFIALYNFYFMKIMEEKPGKIEEIEHLWSGNSPNIVI
jgi:hypothetical protein